MSNGIKPRQPKKNEVAIIHPDGTEELAIFHKWSTSFQPGVDWALVQLKDGTMEYVRSLYLRFLLPGDEVPMEFVEEVYRKNGILKGGAEE